jgi:hypothetical protein
VSVAETDRDKKLTEILARKKESAQWYNDNYYGEWETVYLASKCKTKPITYKNDKGETVEDKARTNVAMPDLAAMIHRNTARMTAQPPAIRYVTRKSADLAEKLTAWSYYQYDRSGESKIQRLHVRQAETFGISFTKLNYDKLVETKPFRHKREDVTSRAEQMQSTGQFSEPDIQQAVSQLGPDMQPEEIANFIATYGPEIIRKTPLKKYEGPVAKFIFVGDLFIEPGVRTLNESAWVIEQYTESDRWLSKMNEQTYVDPETGEELRIFDPAVVKEVLDLAPGDWSNNETISSGTDLRTRLRDITGITEPKLRRDLKGKRYDILECHEMREDGRIWIYWIANEKYYLGEMPYLWDLGGRFLYTEYVPMPDLIFAVGDSTPRLARYLWQLHNVVVNQRTDLVNNLLRRIVFRRHGADIPDEAIERSAFRIYDVKDPNDFIIQEVPDVPASAWESEAAVMRQMALLDGVLNSVDTGSSANPMAGRTATTAVLQQRAVDTMTAAKLAALNMYLKEIGEKKLAMLQQQLQEVLMIPLHYARSQALSQRYGETALIDIDPFEIQEDIEVEPEADSTLSVDDEFRRMSAMQLYQLAEGDPTVWNKWEAAKLVAGTIKGADASKLVLPPTQPPPPPPKGSINLTIKYPELPPDTQQYLLQQMGLPESEFLKRAIHLGETNALLQHVGNVSQAADHATNLASPAEPPVGEGDGTATRPGATPEPRKTLADRV